MKFLVENDLAISVMVTDRHCQVIKYIREELKQLDPNTSDIKHYYDIWHVAKGNYDIYIFYPSIKTVLNT